MECSTKIIQIIINQFLYSTIIRFVSNIGTDTLSWTFSSVILALEKRNIDIYLERRYR